MIDFVIEKWLSMQLALIKDMIVEKKNNNSALVFESDNYFKTEKRNIKRQLF